MTIHGLVRAEAEIDKPAPAFELQDQYGDYHRLQDYSGRWLVLYFYPRDDTPGCTIEACNFREDIQAIRELGAEVVGISIDSIESHRKFAEINGLPFPLLSDPEGKVASSYGALLDIGPARFARRQTFIIDDRGNVARIYRRVDPRTHSGEIISQLQGLMSR